MRVNLLCLALALLSRWCERVRQVGGRPLSLLLFPHVGTDGCQTVDNRGKKLDLWLNYAKYFSHAFDIFTHISAIKLHK